MSLTLGLLTFSSGSGFSLSAGEGDLELGELLLLLGDNERGEAFGESRADPLLGLTYRRLTGERELLFDLLLLLENDLRGGPLLTLGLILLRRGLRERLRRLLIGERLRGDRDLFRGGVRERLLLRVGESLGFPFFDLSSKESFNSSA